MLIQENFSLKKYNTFKVDIKARFFAEVYFFEDLKKILNFVKEKEIPYLILGGGSNILFTQDFEGLVIVLRLKGITENIITENNVLVSSKSGEIWHEFVKYCVSKNYGGIENLSLIPGNVGTSLVQNIGAYGVEIKDVFHSCKVLDVKNLSIKTLKLEDCKFGYRDSIFKSSQKNKYIILEVSFLLTTSQHIINIAYGDIKQELIINGIENPSIKDASDAVISIREKKLPNTNIIGNAGSFFKNPTIPKEKFDILQKKHGNIPNYLNGNYVKIPAAWLVEKSGWKGKTIGNVGTHPHQALVIINATGKASGKEILDFSSKIIDSVKEKFDIELEREVNVV